MSLIHMNHAYSHWKCKLTPFWQVEFANHTVEMQINLWKCESPHGKCESNVNHICVIMNCPMSGWIAILWYLTSESAIIITVVQHHAGHCCAWTTSTGVEVHIYLTEINKYWWSFRSSGAPDCQCFVQCVCWNGISGDVIPTWNQTFRLGIVSDHCAVKTCANDIILTVDW